MGTRTQKSELKIRILKERLQQYYDAETEVLKSQSYSIGSRSLTRANLSEIRSEISKLEGQINALETRGTTKRFVARVIPRDF